MSDSGFVIDSSGNMQMAYGRDAMQVMHVRALALGIKMYVETNGRMIPTRGATITRMMSRASEFTGNKYKRTNAGRMQAVMDLEEWCSLMLSALPIEVKEG